MNPRIVIKISFNLADNMTVALLHNYHLMQATVKAVLHYDGCSIRVPTIVTDCMVIMIIHVYTAWYHTLAFKSIYEKPSMHSH